MDTPPPRPTRQLPATIGRYRVVGRLGKGAMGIVYSAYDDVMERSVAIKVMMADLQDDPETSARFYREAHAAGQLVHRNIITIFDMGDDDGRPYIVMELLEGQTLGEYLKRPGIPLEDKLALMMQVCDGLRLAHGKGIFHRDIKPGNLLVRDDGSLKIVDFGIARLATSSMTVSGLIVGTPDYMSPEQARGREVDQRSDIFSAGAVFYYMLTGRKPFNAANLPAVLNKVQNEDPLPIRDTEAPPALVAVVTKALAKSPTDRYQQVAEVMADLTRVSREVAIETRRAGEEARTQLEAMQALAAERQRWCEELRVAPGPPDIEQFGELVHQHYPAFNDWLNGRTGEPMTSAAAHELLQEVLAARQSLDDELVAVRQAVADLRDAAGAAEAGDLQAALGCCESAAAIVPGSERVREERARVRQRLADQQAAEDRLRALLFETQAAAARGEWPAVMSLTAQALSIDPGNAEAIAGRDRASKELTAESRQRKRQAERSRDRAEKLSRKGRHDEAEQALQEARQLEPESPLLAAIEERISHARLDAERATDLERRAVAAIAAARTEFASGARDRAIDDLQAFLASEPQAPNVASALSALRAAADRLLAEEQRRAEAAEHAGAAAAALEADDLDLASSLVQQALRLVTDHPLARQTQGVVTARLRERALARERQETIERTLQNAVTLLERGSFAAAREQARAATVLDPADGRATALLEAIGQQESRALERQRREQEAARRAKAAAPIVALARAAELKPDPIRAGWLAENALAVDPDCAEAREIIARAHEKVVAEPELVDETVQVGHGANTPADPDATLIIAPAASFWRRIADTLKHWSQMVLMLAPRPRAADGTRVKQP